MKHKLTQVPSVMLQPGVKLKPAFPPTAEMPQIVIQQDDRHQVAQTTVFPANAIAQLMITKPNGQSAGATGTFIGPRTLLTAGHAVFIRDAANVGFALGISVIPGRAGAAVMPFGFKAATAVYAPPAWTDNGDVDNDYGLVFLSEDFAPATFSVVATSDAELNNLAVTISGYPVDKEFGTQWFAAREIQSVTPTQLLYDIDTFEGQSGSAVYSGVAGGGAAALGVHRFGAATGNLATRITAAIKADLDARIV